MPKRRYPGMIDRHGDRFRIRLCVGGRRYTYTLPTNDPKAAQRFAVAKHRKLVEEMAQRSAGIRTGVPFSELLELYEAQLLTRTPNTRRSYGDSLKPIRVYFIDILGDPSLDKVRVADVTAFLAWRRPYRVKGRRKELPTAPVAQRTLQKDLAVLHAMFALGVRMEFVPGNVVARVERPKADPRSPVILSSEQYEALLAECAGRPMLALYATVLGEAGIRCESEALWLRWEDVGLDDGFLQIVSGRGGHRVKSGRSREVPMTVRLREAFRAHFAAYRLMTYSGERSPWVFHHLVAGRHQEAGERMQSMRDALNAAAKRAKIPAEFTQHDLRHRRVTTWLGEGRSPVLVKEAVGHADLRTTMIYTHLSREHLRSLVDEQPKAQPARAVEAIAK